MATSLRRFSRIIRLEFRVVELGSAGRTPRNGMLVENDSPPMTLISQLEVNSIVTWSHQKNEA